MGEEYEDEIRASVCENDVDVGDESWKNIISAASSIASRAVMRVRRKLAWQLCG